MARTTRALLSAAVFAVSSLACLRPASAAAFLDRWGHTSTLLPNGDILICGGQTAVGAYTADCQISLEQVGDYNSGAADMGTARSSFTATLLPNGRVLVTGGFNGAGLNTAEVYDPIANTWAATGNNMAALRFNHTATLLRNGKVLVCGGQSNATTSLASCDLYDPTANTFAPTAGPLAAARSRHSAILRRDGKVWIAGGFDSTQTPQFLVTSEVFDPVSETWSAAHSLIVARADHSATMLGDGRVLLAGGYNGRDVKSNMGYLDTVEIYDPVSDSIVPATSMKVRRAGHGAALMSSGEVAILGGLGNITTTYTRPYTDSFDPGSFVGGNLAGALSIQGPVVNINAGATSLSTTIDLKLGTPFTGVITSGDIFLSTTSVQTPEGALVWLAPSYTSNTAVGTRLNLDGRRVTCPIVSGAYECGHVEGQLLDARMPNQTGTYWIPPFNPSVDAFALTGTHDIHFASTLRDTNTQTTSSGTVTGLTRMRGFPERFIGAAISSGMFQVTSGNFAQPSSMTVTITGGTMYIPAGTTLVADPINGGAMTSLFAATVAYTGDSFWVGVDTHQMFGGPPSMTSATPMGGSIPSITVAGRLTYVLNQLNMTDQVFTTDTATTVVRRMISSDWELFRPFDPDNSVNNNSWRFAVNAISGFTAHWGPSLTVRPDGVIRGLGGVDCLNATCTTFQARGANGLVPTTKNFTVLPPTMSQRRGNHSATLLPNGKILVAGGTNGPNVLDTAEVFDPTTFAFAPTGKMHTARDLHSAVLMPNGRVLVAGGFATTATSSGATREAEVYHPDTGLWHKTPPMISSHSNHATVLLHSGDVMVIGGYANGNYLRDVEIYYSTANVWRTADPLPAACGAVTCARAQAAAAVLHDGRVLVSGGLNSSGVLGTSVVYNPATGLWSHLAGGDFAGAAHAHSHSMSTLPNGRVIAAGGNDEFGETSMSQGFDPSASTWDHTRIGGVPSSLVTPRFNHASIVTPDGAVIIAGGSQSMGNSILFNELFTPSGSTWTASTELINPRSYGSATLGNDGFIYYIGGYDGVEYLASAERTYYTAFPDYHTQNTPPSTRLPQVVASDPPVSDTATILTLTGNRFHGNTESSGGNGGAMSSSHFHPRVVLQRQDGATGTGSQGSAGFTIDLTTRIYRAGSNPSWDVTNSSISVLLPSNPGQLPRGWYQARVGASAIYSNALMMQIGPSKLTAAPASLSATALGVSSVVWTWSALAGGGNDGFDVWSGTSGIFIATVPLSGVVPAQGAPCAGPCHFQTDLGPNTSVQLNVAGYNLSGDGPLTRSATFFTLAAVPSSFQISSVTANSILLTWNRNGNRDGTIYEVSQSSDNFLTGPIISTPTESLNLQTTYFTISPLAENTTYYFRLRAFNGANVATAFTAIVSTRTRSPVFGLNGGAISPTSINWSWNNPGGVINYRVYNATSGALIASPSANSYLDTGLSTNSPRAVQVTAITGAGEGPLSPSVTVYTLAATPGLAGQPFLFIGTGSFVVTWMQNQNPPATQFQLWVSSNAGLTVTTATTPSLQAGMGDLREEGELWETRVYALNGDNVLSVPLILGSTPTLAGPINNLSLVGNGPDYISVAWSSFTLYGVNTTSVTYQLTYSTDDFVTNITTAIAFSAGYNGYTATIASLLTSTTYSIRLAARNAVGKETSFSNVITTRTDSGAGIGQIGGDILANENTLLTGTLGTVPPRRVIVQIPAGTFSSDVRMVISSQPMTGNNLCATSNTSTSTVGVNFTVTPALQPTGVFYVTVGYEASEIAGLNASKLMLLRHEPSFGKCVPIESYVDTAARRVTGKLDHLSLFQIGAVAPAGTTDGARIFPNPWYSSRTGHVTFHQLPADAKIKIFTARGELVHEFNSTPTGIVSWDGHNRGGRRVSSGVYLVVVESGDSRKILKLVVLR